MPSSMKGLLDESRQGDIAIHMRLHKEIKSTCLVISLYLFLLFLDKLCEITFVRLLQFFFQVFIHIVLTML